VAAGKRLTRRPVPQQAQLVDPVPEDLGVLAGAEVRCFVEPAGEEEVIRLQASLLDPRLHGIPGGRRDLELGWALGLVLHDDGARGNLVPMTNISDLQGDETAPTAGTGIGACVIAFGRLTARDARACSVRYRRHPPPGPRSLDRPLHAHD
jgi:hypothetical protein